MSAPTFEVVRIAPDPADARYAQERALRWEVLRKAQGMAWGSERFAHEDDAWHLVAVEAAPEGPRVVGCVMFHPQGPGVGRLLQMAVREDRHGAGVGRQLVRALEALAAEAGFRTVVLHSRESAIGFYERLGYQLDGPTYLEVGIPHRNMRRDLGTPDLL